MKKLLIGTSLALATAASWAFYPKEAAPAGYLAVIGSGRPGASHSPEITTIYPDGRRQVMKLTGLTPSSERSSTAIAVELHHAEMVKINKLYAQGWRIVSITQSTVGVGAITETVYLMEKR
ncbi:hypothetical protein I2I05_04585 [Hymenobacter sp. BT683]|uniref:DUF4177 domain-containing protein n=1 Tax=Hymenobacter jeongseonensis TaxID=2791027 RepID=A0ABS0IE97_9BACT|nr:hypothetical protein [Hymenobacter jeongseonensis]MBF9236666.1 hypothetical protein [Hymenobacter jeongseonensis]